MADGAFLQAILADARGLTVSDVGEKRLLGEFLLPLCRELCGDLGLGDDAGTVPFTDGGDVVITTDRVPTDLLALQFGVMGWRELGSYLVRVNVSDLAAMGADPLALVVTCGFPNATPVAQVVETMYGAYSSATEFGCPVVGGDTKSSKELTLSAAAIGRVPRGRSLGRGPVSAGMNVFLSGPIGHAGAALRWFADPENRPHESRVSTNSSVGDSLRKRLITPEPRIDLSVTLRESSLSAAMDVTDGLGQSLLELAQTSDVGIVIYEDRLQFDDATRMAAEILGVSLTEIAGGIGLDLEIVAIGNSNPEVNQFYVIGEVVEGPARVLLSSGQAFPISGFEHFAHDALYYLRSKASGPSGHGRQDDLA